MLYFPPPVLREGVCKYLVGVPIPFGNLFIESNLKKTKLSKLKMKQDKDIKKKRLNKKK